MSDDINSEVSILKRQLAAKDVAAESALGALRISDKALEEARAQIKILEMAIGACADFSHQLIELMRRNDTLPPSNPGLIS